jgi:opacity protein-like surface antigen
MVETPPPPEGEPSENWWHEAGFTWALQIGVPIFLDVDRDVVKAGADISWFGGADFGSFIVGGAAGIGWNPIDLNNSGIPEASGRSPVTRLFLSIPEVRFQVPGLKVVLPYISGAFDINWWNFRETQLVCGAWYCTQSSVYRFSPGFTGRGGLAFEAKGGIYVDVGLRYSFTGKGDFFQQSRWYLTPYVGVLLRRRN